MYCLKMHGFAAPEKETISIYAFNLLQTKLLYVFCSSVEPFILVGLQQTMELPYLLPIFASNASLCSSCMF